MIQTVKRDRVWEGNAALSALCFVLATDAVGCRKEPYRTFSPESGEFSCEIPSDWKKGEARGFLLAIHSPDHIGYISADINIVKKQERHDQATILDEMAGGRAIWARDPEFIQESMKQINIGNITGFGYTETISNALGESPIPYKTTRIYFDALEGHYRMEYNAPVALYDKYYPHFEHLIRTFRMVNKR